MNLTSNGNALQVYRTNVAANSSLGALPISTTGKLGTTTFALEIINGKIDFLFSMFGNQQCAGKFDLGPCRTSFDFFNSARFLAATVLDENGNVLSNPSVTSASGFDYLVGLKPHSVPAVPIPASGAMFGSLLAGLIGWGRRRRSVP